MKPARTRTLAGAVILAIAAAAGMPGVRSDARAGESAEAETAPTPEDRAHWAFLPLADGPVPSPADSAREVVNPVDAFLLARLEAAGLASFAPEADRRTLIRRLSFDLTGLPPEPDAIEAFVHDTSPDAYEALIERLLASPAYGEKQAQHWLDLARYAESDGFEFDHERRDAWRYRDWVIAAFNADLPYDEFVRMQLAADELSPADPDAAAATGFLRCGPDMVDINLAEERRHTLLNEMTSTVGAVFLGLTLECAQCHHHKADPISIQDFYRLRAFLENTVVAPEKMKQLPTVVREPGPEPPTSRVMVRGDFRLPGESVEPAFPRVLDPRGTPVFLSAPNDSSSGRRSALASWIARPDNALALRVIANRLWQHHFTRPLVATPNDFGRSGSRPTHPGLLDWLAAELPRRGWSLKAMHRLLVSSRAYRQASRGDGPDWNLRLRHDPDNALVSRMNRRRLTGEEIRDAMLVQADLLDRRMGGPGIRPPLPSEVTETLLKDQWDVTADASQHDRRSVYLFVRRNLRFPLFDAFDRPDPNVSCPRRHASTTAPQALTLLNSPLSHRVAARLAQRVVDDARVDALSSDQTVAFLYRTVLGRPPDTKEAGEAAAFLESQSSLLREEGSAEAPESDPRQSALHDLGLALLNSNEAIHID